MAEKQCMALQRADDARAALAARVWSGEQVPPADMRAAFGDLRGFLEWSVEHRPESPVGRFALLVVEAVVELDAQMESRRVCVD